MNAPKPHLVHATCVAVEGNDGLRGILLRGASGAGKSDLALRMIDQGALLVADDQCALARQDGRLVASAPAAIAGALEVRGVGLRDVPSLAEVPLALIVDLVAADEVDRLPEAATEEILGIAVAHLALDPFAASAPAKLRLALRGTAAALPRGETPVLAPKAVTGPGSNGGRQVAIVTGLSGAGHSSALKILEDLGYESVDNLPLSLLDALLDEGGPVAVGVDIRTRNFAPQPLLDPIRTRP